MISHRLSFKAFFIILVACVLFIPSSSTEITEPIRDGDYIYIDDSKAYLKGTYSATHGEDIEHWAMTKQFTGDCDMAIGFDGEVAWPTKVLLEDPHYEYWDTNTSKTFYYVTNFATTTDAQDYGNWYNSQKYKFDHKIFLGYNKITNESIWQDVIGTVAYFDSQTNDGTNYTVKWRTEHSRLEQYRDISNIILSNPIEYEYDGKNLWFVTKDIPMTANEMRKIVIEMDGKMEWGVGNSYKYDIIWKPSHQTIAEAIVAGNLYVLDPLWNSSYNIRLKMPINNTAGAGQLSDFQINTNLSTYSANASSLRCYNRSTGNIMAHWNETVVSGNVNELWTNNSVIASGWDNNTFCAWQTTPTASSSSSGTDTFTSFFDGDSTGWTEVDPNSHISYANNRLEWSGLDRDEDAYVYQSALVNESLVIKYTYKITGILTGGITNIACGGDMLDDFLHLDNGFRSYGAYRSGALYYNNIAKRVSDSQTSGGNIDYVVGTQYWVTTTINRSGNGVTKIYSDSGRTTQVGSDSSVSLSDLSATLQYMYLISSWNSGNSDMDVAGWMDDFKAYEYNSAPPVYESLELEYYIPSLYYNSTSVLNIIYSNPYEYALNQTLTGKTNTNDTAGSTGLSEIVITNYNNSESIVRNFTLTGDDLDWYQAANLSGSYNMKNSSSTIQTVNDGNFTTNLVAGDYWIEQAGISIVLLSQTPSIIYTNSTGCINISYGISHDSSGLNNTSISFIYRNYDWDLSDSNHSIRPPANDLASVWNFNGRILRAANRNETPGLNFENNATITGGDTYTWSGLDENSTKLTIVPVNSTYTKVYINATVHCIMPQMWYLDRTDQQQATKTQLAIHKTSNVLIKFWNFEIYKGNYDFLGVGYTDTLLSSNPALWPSDANPINFYYVNSSYDPATGGDPITSGYAVYMGSLNASGWTDHVYSRSNSNYVRGFIDNNYLHTVINTTNISYLYFTSNTPSSHPFYINMTNVATSTNRTFANTNTLWAGNNPPYTLQSYTPNVWFAFMKLNMSLDHKLYAADNNDLWGGSSMNRTNITQALFPPTTPSFYAFHNEFKDVDMNGIYHDTIQIQVSASSDPDGGVVTHNITLHYGNKTYVATINGSAVAEDGVYTNITFNTTPYYSQTENYTLRVVATDDESESVTVWLGVNFSLDGSPRIISYSPDTPVYSEEGENQTFSITTNLLGNVTWYIDSVEVFNETDVNTSSYSNNTASVGIYNITVVTTNTNGTNSMTWDWTVTLVSRMPLSIFIMWSVIMFAGAIIGFMTNGLYGITSSLLTATIAYMNSKNIINGNVVQYFSGVSTSDTIVVGYRTIESLPMSYIYLFIAIVMVIVFIIQVKNEIQYNLEPDMDGEFFDE